MNLRLMNSIGAKWLPCSPVISYQDWRAAAVDSALYIIIEHWEAFSRVMKWTDINDDLQPYEIVISFPTDNINLMRWMLRTVNRTGIGF